ncbi:helix-turn-helix domain-containing protein [Listeria grayi]|uniref:helix-turn-helix domain-containing protein n=1 Tax=Listeria grayi TaxID=1641 RepID=UPI001629BB31|nr:helix-turn-helix transcriptional regulator [Listeria grayi]MBC1923176.1 transposase [Listeria grayi]
MSTFDIIKKLSVEKGKNVKEVALELGFGENLFYKWKTQSPTTDKLQKVADYFNVSTDYLLGRTNDRYSHLKIEDSNITSNLETSNDFINILKNADKEKLEKLEQLWKILNEE